MVPSRFAELVTTVVTEIAKAKDTLVNNTREKKLISIICQC